MGTNDLDHERINHHLKFVANTKVLFYTVHHFAFSGGNQYTTNSWFRRLRGSTQYIKVGLKGAQKSPRP
jgi:hypothetical protein